MTLSAIALPSCLKDQEDLFDSTSSERLQQTLDLAKETLVAAPNGWVMDYFPDRDISYGGFVYGLKFDSNEVEVWFELAPGMSEKSLYKLTNNNGPVLSFDSYNTLMHFFATPSGSRYEAYDGDFEFMIMDVKPDLITLMGNRTGNTIYMHRLDQEPGAYVSAASTIGDAMFFTELNGTQGSAPISAAIDLGVRYIEFVWGEGDEDYDGSYYVPTPTGMRLVSSVNVNGATIDAVDFDPETLTYSTTDSKGNKITLNGTIPEDYAFYDEYIGDYSMHYDNGKTADIKVQSDGNGGYIVKGFSPQFDLVASHNKSKGCLELCSQQVGTADNMFFWCCATNGSNFSWGTSVGMLFIKDPKNEGTYLAADNKGTSFAVTGFYMAAFAGEVSGNGYTGGGGNAPAPWRFMNGSYDLDNVVSIVKK